MVLTISSGHSAEYLTGAVAAGRENYYTGAVAEGEPPGRWSGRGAAALGLAGEVETQDMTALYEHFVDPRDEAFSDPSKWGEASTLGHAGRAYLSEDDMFAKLVGAEPHASPERRAELRIEASKRSRKNVSFLDATFSVQKSVTVLHTAFEAQEVAATNAGDGDAAGAWRACREAVESAIWAGNAAQLEYLADRAGYSRVGHHGGAAGRWVDSHDWTVASFFQHDSRDHDPQLHIHNAILNRVQGADGTWRTLDGRGLYAHRGAAAAVGERVMEEHLTAALGVRFATRPDGKAREVHGVPQDVMDLFSSRRRAITAKTATLVSGFREQFGREPNSLELDRLSRKATFATRRAKSHDGETAEERLARWDRQLRNEVGAGLARVANAVLEANPEFVEPESWSPQAVIDTALASVQGTKAAWTRPDLIRAISDALPDHLGVTNAGQIVRLLDTLADEALVRAVKLDADGPAADVLPAALRLADGTSAYNAPGRAVYATPEHLHTERLLAAAGVRRGAPAMAAEQATGFVRSLAELGVELGVDQAAAVRGVLTSGAATESLVGPAGTGKSFVVGALAKGWTDHTLWDGARRQMFGLAASQVATDVLTSEGVPSMNITRWLSTQHRLSESRGLTGDHAWTLRVGDLVVVDESAMADTAALDAIRNRVDHAGAKLLLTGDHRQLAAVGAAGGMELAAQAGRAYELTEARRFRSPWEAAASLRLRAGDQSVLQDYHREGRIRDGGTVEEAERQAARAWLADTLNGRESLLVVDTNEQAARLSADIRARLVGLGLVDEDGVRLGLDGTTAGVGDLIQARKNGWDLAGYDGNTTVPINRATYRVTGLRVDGGLTVAPIVGRSPDGEQLGGPLQLPVEYVSEHVALGYASTVHSAQGRTVDTTHVVAATATSLPALYVGMTRGRHANIAHVVTRRAPSEAPTGDTAKAARRGPLGVLATAFETDAAGDLERAAATEIARRSVAALESQQAIVERFADRCEQLTATRVPDWLDALTDVGYLTPAQRAAIAVEDGAATLGRVLRRAELAGHDPRQALTDAVTCRSLDDARELTNVVHHRIATAVTLAPVGEDYRQWIPADAASDDRVYLEALADAAHARRAALADRAVTAQPGWAVEAFGPLPDDLAQRRVWTEQVGAVAAHREVSGWVDDTKPLGPAPTAGQPEQSASWHAAWRALGSPEEAQLTDGRLLARVRAHEREEAWGPDYVADQLAGTRQAAADQRETATLRAAQAAAADAAQDVELAARLRQEAEDAAALASTLDARAAELADVDDARAHWLAHTAETKARADAARDELKARHPDGFDDDRVTAAEDPHRPITAEHDLADVADDRATDERTAERMTPAGADGAATMPAVAAGVSGDGARSLDTSVFDDATADAVAEALPGAARIAEADQMAQDLRDVAAVEPAREADTSVRVPTAEESADAVRRAQRALAEITQRTADDARREAEAARADQLTGWHAADHSTTAAHDRATDTGRSAADDGPVLTRE